MSKQPQTASHRKRNEELYEAEGLVYRRRKHRQMSTGGPSNVQTTVDHATEITDDQTEFVDDILLEPNDRTFETLVEHGVEHDDVHEDTSSSQIGPKSLSVLKSFKTHIAYKIWNKTVDRELLRPIGHSVGQSDWDLNQPHNQHFAHHIYQSGLASLCHATYKHADKILVSAFVERWHPETNTFHMPFGEMTITLYDVQQLLGLQVTGTACTGRKLSRSDAISLIVEALGVSTDVAKSQLSQKGLYVKLSWLRTLFTSSSDRPDDQVARAFLLHLLGCTLFVDKTGNSVPVSYLTLLEDIETIHEYAWGAAALAYLYRQLGTASRYDAKQLSGYLTLLQAWIYEHIPVCAPSLNPNYNNQLPLVQRWGLYTRTSVDKKLLEELRETLDDLTAYDVIWDPYCTDIPEITFFHGCIRFLEVVEPYHSHRVLRQFRHVQSIPPDPVEPFKVNRGSNPKMYKVEFHFADQYWTSWDSHVLSQQSRGARVNLPIDCSSDYMQWYENISHVRVQNPIHRLTRGRTTTTHHATQPLQPERPVSILKNIIVTLL